MMPSFVFAAACVLLVCLTVAPAVASGPDFRPVDEIIQKAIAHGACPGAELLVGRADRTLYRKTYGKTQVKPRESDTVIDQVYDLASLTKPVATATSIMILHDRGKLNVNDPVAKYIPQFAQNGKASVTIAQCLTHTAGFIADNPMSDYADGGDRAVERIIAAPLQHKPGEKFVYSDVGYIVLGELVGRVDGRTLDRFAAEEVFGPLMMARTCFKPNLGDLALLVPTEAIDGDYKRGVVHDPRARAMGGVAGHAGLFGSATDLARFCQMLLNGGALSGKRILSVEAVKLMLTPRPSPDDSVLRTYGFDVVSPYDSPRGQYFPKGTSFGHTGFTGTSLWIDPESKLYVILLTSRLHPDGKGDVKQLRYDVATAVAEVALGAR